VFTASEPRVPHFAAVRHSCPCNEKTQNLPNLRSWWTRGELNNSRPHLKFTNESLYFVLLLQHKHLIISKTTHIKSTNESLMIMPLHRIIPQLLPIVYQIPISAIQSLKNLQQVRKISTLEVYDVFLKTMQFYASPGSAACFHSSSVIPASSRSNLFSMPFTDSPFAFADISIVAFLPFGTRTRKLGKQIPEQVFHFE